MQLLTECHVKIQVILLKDTKFELSLFTIFGFCKKMGWNIDLDLRKMQYLMIDQCFVCSTDDLEQIIIF